MSRIHEAMKQAAEMAAKAHELPVVEGLTPMTVDEADGLSREPFPIEIGEHLRNRQAEAPEPLPPPVMAMPVPLPPTPVAVAPPAAAVPVMPAPPISTPPAPTLSQIPMPAPVSMPAAPPPAAPMAAMPVAPPQMAAPLPIAARPSVSLPLHTNAPNGNGAHAHEQAVDAALDAALARELPPLLPREPLVPREPRRPLAPAIGTAAFRDQDEGGVVESKHFLDYLRVFYKRRVSAAITFLIVVLGGAVYTWTSTPIYEARVQLMIENERPVVRVFKDDATVEAAADKADYQETQNKILASRGLAGKVLDTLGLWSRPELTGSEQPSGVRRFLIPVVNIGAKVVSRFSMTDWTVRKKDAPGEGETGDRSRVVDTFLDHLTIAPVRNSRLVDVKFQSPDPKLAADISNTLADEYIKQTREYKKKSSTESSDLLTGQLEEQKKTLLASEAALQHYREQTDAMSTAERDNQLQLKLNELTSQLTRAQADQRAREQTLEQLKKALDDPKALDIHPAIVASSAVQAVKAELAGLEKREAELKENLGPRNPEMIALRDQIQRAQVRMRGEQGKVVDAVEAELDVVSANVKNLTEQVDAQKVGATAMRRKQGEYDALEREAASNRDVFESLLQRTKENGVSSEILVSNIRVVDAADVPHTPISPQRFRDMSVAVVAGLAFSVLIAFAREYLDKRIKTPDEVKAQLGLPCVGLIPAITRDTPVLSNGVPALFSEAFRALRTSVLFASAEEGAHTLLITSTGPNEGKTLVAVNLAVSLAQTGRRVLIIDADLRRPTVHKLLGETQEPGMSGITEPGWSVESVIRGTYVENLSMIPAGALPHYPAELLASEAFKQVVKRLAEVYDWVILDSPPVMAVTDAVLIGHLADGVVFVIGSEQTAGPTAVNALEKLHAGHARFLGAVLNKCKLEHDRHYYQHHYRPEYQEYYGVKDN